jgi:hypothetical protein
LSKVVAICQSNYIPWKGYFDMINMADVFVLYDDVQYTKNDWRNRNMIKTFEGPSWLTMPVKYKFRGKDTQKINETKILDKAWALKHWARIKQVYSKAEFFSVYNAIFEEMYLNKLQNLEYLSEINQLMIKTICEVLDIKTKIISSAEFQLTEDRNERLLQICHDLDATQYLSGPAAKEYMDMNLFKDAGVEVIWMDYSKYPVYEQMYGVFEHGVSILDVIFNCGPKSMIHMASQNQ